MFAQLWQRESVREKIAALFFVTGVFIGLFGTVTTWQFPDRWLEVSGLVVSVTTGAIFTWMGLVFGCKNEEGPFPPCPYIYLILSILSLAAAFASMVLLAAYIETIHEAVISTPLAIGILVSYRLERLFERDAERADHRRYEEAEERGD